ncbi:hypothetical protein Pelo_18335 [Pelomyxa schiedti]|nr:hypothetical protein Pelo_18335 [Pelomyxa schiedti]
MCSSPFIWAMSCEVTWLITLETDEALAILHSLGCCCGTPALHGAPAESPQTTTPPLPLICPHLGTPLWEFIKCTTSGLTVLLAGLSTLGNLSGRKLRVNYLYCFEPIIWDTLCGISLSLVAPFDKLVSKLSTITCRIPSTVCSVSVLIATLAGSPLSLKYRPVIALLQASSLMSSKAFHSVGPKSETQITRITAKVMMDNNTSAVDEPPQQPKTHHHHSSETEKQRILKISRVVWEQVVVPWVLRPAVARRKWARELPRPAVSCVLATAEAMFPLVALASRAVSAGPSPTRYRELGHYRDLEDAAAALSPKCVTWIISNNAKSRRERRRKAALLRDHCDGGGGSVGDRNHGSDDGVTDGGDDDDDEGVEVGMMRREREWVAVLTGLCCGGNLEMAKRLAETRLNAIIVLELIVIMPILVMCVQGAVALCDEFWSEKGMFNLVRRVCAAGHLDVLQWVLTDVLQLNRSELVGVPLVQAAVNGQLHIIQWLVSTFDLDNDATTRVAVADSFHPRKGRVSDVKCLVETFPHWDFSESARSLAGSAAFCKGCPADEIIEVCQWLKDRFLLNGEDFISPDSPTSLPKSAKVVKWALSDFTGAYEMSNLWDLCSLHGGNVELGKWLVEEKGVRIGTDSFLQAFSCTHDNVEFFEWMFKKLDALHRALANPNRLELVCKWLA